MNGAIKATPNQIRNLAGRRLLPHPALLDDRGKAGHGMLRPDSHRDRAHLTCELLVLLCCRSCLLELCESRMHPRSELVRKLVQKRAHCLLEV